MEPRSAVEIEPSVVSLPGDADGLELLRSVRGRGRDDAGLVELELDAVGDLVSVEVGDLATGQSAGAIAAAFTQAFAAARAATTAALEEHADELTARAQVSSDRNLEALEAIAARAQDQMDEVVAKLEAVEKGAGRG